MRYAERNPVSANLCQQPVEWPRSSAHAHLQGTDDGLVTVQPILYRISDWATYLADTDSIDKMESIRRHNRTGRPLGCTEFIKTLELKTGKTLAPKRHGPKPHTIN